MQKILKGIKANSHEKRNINKKDYKNLKKLLTGKILKAR